MINSAVLGYNMRRIFPRGWSRIIVARLTRELFCFEVIFPTAPIFGRRYPGAPGAVGRFRAIAMDFYGYDRCACGVEVGNLLLHTWCIMCDNLLHKRRLIIISLGPLSCCRFKLQITDDLFSFFFHSAGGESMENFKLITL